MPGFVEQGLRIVDAYRFRHDVGQTSSRSTHPFPQLRIRQHLKGSERPTAEASNHGPNVLPEIL